MKGISDQASGIRHRSNHFDFLTAYPVRPFFVFLISSFFLKTGFLLRGKQFFQHKAFRRCLMPDAWSLMPFIREVLSLRLTPK